MGFTDLEDNWLLPEEALFLMELVLTMFVYCVVLQ